MALTPEEIEVNLLSNRYEHYRDIYKFYLEYARNILVFYYVVTGGIVAFWVDDVHKQPDKWLALLLVIIFGFTFAGLFFYGALLWRWMEIEIEKVAERLREFIAVGDYGDAFHVLRYVLLVFAVLMVITSLGLWYFGLQTISLPCVLGLILLIALLTKWLWCYPDDFARFRTRLLVMVALLLAVVVFSLTIGQFGYLLLAIAGAVLIWELL